MFVAIAQNNTDSINAFANEYNKTFSFKVADIKPERSEGWTSYLLGVTYYLQGDGL